MSFHYKDIVPWGRSFDEYLDMFDLSEDDLARNIVDVGGGPASFNSGMHQRGTPIISVDPIYQFSERNCASGFRKPTKISSRKLSETEINSSGHDSRLLVN